MYYPFIDGLRAIAVLAVVAYHLEERWLPGGFSGVDMFFAISGFVVSASVAGFDTRSVAGFAGRFYSRRIRRILPALLASLLTTSLAAALLIPQAWLSDGIYLTGLKAFFGLSNYQLATSANDYFSPKVDFNPYTHTWSLGVEEQFYLLFPLAFLAWLRGGCWRILSLAFFAAGFVASMLYAWKLHASGNTTGAFYLTTSRFWQLAAGVLLYQWLPRAGDPAAGMRWPRWLRGLLLALSIGALAWALLRSRPAHAPWPDGLAPVAGTLGLIAALTGAGGSGPLAIMLSSAPMAAIGRVSYSLYLWHWPVFVLFRWTVGLDSWFDRSAALALAALMAVFSYFCIETPFRRGARIARLRPAVVVAVALLGMAGGYKLFAAVHAREDRLSLSTVVRHQHDWYTQYALPVPVVAGCDVPIGFEPLGGGQMWVLERTGCTASAPVAEMPRIFAAGDSHAGAYSAMLRRYAMENGVGVRLYQSPGCTYFGLGLAREFEDRRCKGEIEAAMADVVRRARPGDVLFLPALRLQRLSDQWRDFDADEMRKAMNSEAAGAARKDGVDYAVGVLHPIAERGVHIVFEAPKPLFPAPPFRCADAFNRFNPICAGGLSMPRRELEAYRQPVIAAMQEAVRRLPGATIWDPFPALCPRDACTAIQDGRPLFFDGDHLSGYGNELLFPGFVRHVGAVRTVDAAP